MSLHLVPWQRRGVFVTGWLLLASGAAWLGLHYTVGAGAGELPHPGEPWLMRLHGLAAFVSLFLLGALAASHVPAGWRASARPRHAGQRPTGVVLLALAALLCATGYALYYFAPEDLRPALGWLHAVAGAAMAAGIWWHQRATRR